MAHSEDYVLPDNVPANEFLNLEGQKLSTSRGFAVWLPEYLEKFQPDPLRYTLARNLPETRDTNFTWEDFQARNNNELGNNFGNLINRVLTFVAQVLRRQGAAARRTDRRSTGRPWSRSGPRRRKGRGCSWKASRSRRRGRDAPLAAQEGNRYFDEAQPWATRKTDMARCGTSLYVCCQYLRAFAGLWAMVLPFSMEKLWAALHMEQDLWRHGWPEGDWMLPAGHPVESPGILFAKIDDESIAAEKARLQAVTATL